MKVPEFDAAFKVVIQHLNKLKDEVINRQVEVRIPRSESIVYMTMKGCSKPCYKMQEVDPIIAGIFVKVINAGL